MLEEKLIHLRECRRKIKSQVFHNADVDEAIISLMDIIEELIQNENVPPELQRFKWGEAPTAEKFNLLVDNIEFLKRKVLLEKMKSTKKSKIKFITGEK